MFTWLGEQMKCSTSILLSKYHRKMAALELHVQSIADQDSEFEIRQEQIRIDTQKLKDAEGIRKLGRVIAKIALEKLLDDGMEAEAPDARSLKNFKNPSLLNRNPLSLGIASPLTPTTILVGQLTSDPGRDKAIDKNDSDDDPCCELNLVPHLKISPVASDSQAILSSKGLATKHFDIKCDTNLSAPRSPRPSVVESKTLTQLPSECLTGPSSSPIPPRLI